MKQENVKQNERKRKATFNVNPIILNRWSPRSMTGEDLDNDVIMSLFEAARWAPSSFNNQPWRFIYAKRNTMYWNQLFDLLLEPNKVWVKNAALLITISQIKILNTMENFLLLINLIQEQHGKI